MKNDKTEHITSIPMKYYIIMMLVGALIIFLYAFMTECDQPRTLLSSFLIRFLEFLAAGIFPAVIVAFLTDCANTRQKKKEYEEFYKDSVNVLKAMCENLPATLHACIADIYQSERAPETAWTAKKDFRGWCLELASKNDTEQIGYLNQEFLQIKAEVEKALRNLCAYQSWREKDRNAALDTMIQSCNSILFRLIGAANNDTSTGKWRCNPDKFIRAILDLFPPELPENKDIKLGYTQPFNSDDYCD